MEVDPGALGSIVKNAAMRARIYAIVTVIGIVLQCIIAAILAGAGTALACNGAGFSVWFTVPLVALAAVCGAYLPIQVQATMLARANTN